MRTGSLQTVAALVLAMAVGASAATITVNATDDGLATDGNCTLREAILAANGDTAVDACVAGSGPDMVVVPAGTYHLAGAANEDAGLTGDLDITDDLDLVGAGATTTVILTPADSSGCTCSGWGCVPCFPLLDRVLDIDPAGSGISVHVSGVTLRNMLGVPGVAEGGKIRNRGTLAVTGSVIEDAALVLGPSARGGGISSQGPLRIEGSVVQNNGASFGGSPSGGGISALGPLEVIDSTISGNKAGSDGGGISASGPVTLVRSTVSGNAAPVGGGLAVENATIVNSTISNNGVGGVVASGVVDLSNVTITENAGSGLTGGGVVLRNTIVAGNEVDCVVASTTGDAYNLDGDGSCGLSGTDQPGLLARLGPLADNGGPTFTHAPLPGSPASGMGSPAIPGSGGTACEVTDQRGVVRPGGARCDVGAVDGVDTMSTTPPCPLHPRPGCQPALGGRSKLVLKYATNNPLSWSWVASTPVPVGDFGDPVAGATGYTLCLYDEGIRRQEARAPAGETCGKRPCWKATSSGFSYADPLLDPDGLKKTVLKAGTVVGKAKIKLKEGPNPLLPPLPFATPVGVQLLRGGTSTCWEASFSTSTRNDGTTFTARSDP